MVFNSIEYALFLPLVFAIYWTIRPRYQNHVVLAASYLFYGWWDYRFLGLLALSTVVDFSVGRALRTTEEERRRRALLVVSLATNLGILGFFKYYGFFVESAAGALASLGLGANLPFLQVVLPVGISFYTFQTLSYTIDVFRRRVEPTDDLVLFATYVAFFPQLVAGPIERAERLLPQLAPPRLRLHPEQIRTASILILMGLFKKVAIADALAPSVDAAFADAAVAGWVRLLINLYAFALQIYGDFSGYTDIARGSGRLLGIELMENFNQPYLSRNITDFWRTWHISLSTWLRDYLYIPLGGNRQGPTATYRNLMITMLLGGLWHGAAWTFVVWGALHGLYLSAHRRFRPDRPPQEPRVGWRDVPAILATFHLVCLTWIFFRAETFSQAFDYLAGIVTLRPAGAGGIDANTLGLLLPAGLAMMTIDLLQRQWRTKEVFLRFPEAARGIAYAAMVAAVVAFSGAPTVPFIYFQF